MPRTDGTGPGEPGGPSPPAPVPGAVELQGGAHGPHLQHPGHLSPAPAAGTGPGLLPGGGEAANSPVGCRGTLRGSRGTIWGPGLPQWSLQGSGPFAPCQGPSWGAGTALTPCWAASQDGTAVPPSPGCPSLSFQISSLPEEHLGPPLHPAGETPELLGRSLSTASFRAGLIPSSLRLPPCWPSSG